MDSLVIAGKRVYFADLPLEVIQAVAISCEVTFSKLLTEAADNPVGGPLLVAAVCKHLGKPIPETWGEYVACLVQED